MCNFTRYPIDLPIPSEGDPLGANAIDSALAERLEQARQHPGDHADGEPHNMLFLSGGSQNGAFGAGFLDGWAQAGADGLPHFDVVTGISTGSILATFAFIDRTEPLVRRYSIRNERELLDPIVRAGNGRPSRLSYLRVIRRGAVADLAPLRTALLEEIDSAVLHEVAARSRPEGGRALLLVGVVDMDSGGAVALDLSDMAMRFAQGDVDSNPHTETDAQRRVRDCYVEAIVASSSAPLAALPVFIDNRMYVDGGARFGMFSNDVVAGISKVNDGRPNQFYVIANGDLELQAECGKADRTLCTSASPTGGTYGDHADWSLLDLAMRSEQILVNQVYRFSASHILNVADKTAPPRFARIGANAQSYAATIEDPELGGPARFTCAEWRAMDRDLLHPIQFYPRYMRCLIAYGTERGREGRWDHPPAPLPETPDNAADAARDAPAPEPAKQVE